MFFRHFQIAAESIGLIGPKVASVSDSERVPVHYFDLEDTIVDTVALLLRLFFEEELDFRLLLHDLLESLHAFNKVEYHTISIFVGVLDSI